MDKADFDAIGGFSSVWSRVSGQPVSLTELADSAERQHELLCALARRCPQASSKLMGLARGEASLICRLCAEHFLESGEEYTPAPACAVVRGALCAMREAWLNSGSIASRLSDAANSASGELRGALDCLAAGESARTRALRELLLRELGANCS